MILMASCLSTGASRLKYPIQSSGYVMQGTGANVSGGNKG